MSVTVAAWVVSAVAAQQGAVTEPPVASDELEFPAGDGRDLFMNTCGECHEAAIVTDMRQSQEQWKSVVASMVDRGAAISADGQKAIVEYLTAHFGKDLNLNTAPAATIQRFLRLSKEEASAVVSYRKSNGDFKSWEDVAKIPGVDVKKIEGKKDALKF